MDIETQIQFLARIDEAFSPFAPINEARFFAGRSAQRSQVVDAILATGRHAVLFGERGVGKTSLANMLKEWLGQATAVAHVSVSAGDTFETLLRRAFSSYQLTLQLPGVGFTPHATSAGVNLGERLPGISPLVPDQVARTIEDLGFRLVIVVDEFDRLPKDQIAHFADLMKSLSDDRSPSTVILVGVAESVNDLVGEHTSISRSLMEILVPRMSDDELLEIQDNGFKTAHGVASDKVKRRIVDMSQGFPHYAHLLGRYASLTALDAAGDLALEDSYTVAEFDVLNGMKAAVQQADQTHREGFHKAVAGDPGTLWVPVVTACALAQHDDRGYFTSRAVENELHRLIPDRKVVQQTFSYHLGELTTVDRGPLLDRQGPERRYLYRFTDPLMRPYIIMRAEAEGRYPLSQGEPRPNLDAR